jgi:hypothetical protein
MMARKGVILDVNANGTREGAVTMSNKGKGKEKENEDGHGIAYITKSECLLVARGALLTVSYVLRILDDGGLDSLDVQLPVASQDGRSLFGSPGIPLEGSGDYQRSIVASIPPSSKSTSPARLDDSLPPSRPSGTGRPRGYPHPIRLRL